MWVLTTAGFLPRPERDIHEGGGGRTISRFLLLAVIYICRPSVGNDHWSPEHFRSPPHLKWLDSHFRFPPCGHVMTTSKEQQKSALSSKYLLWPLPSLLIRYINISRKCRLLTVEKHLIKIATDHVGWRHLLKACNFGFICAEKVYRQFGDREVRIQGDSTIQVWVFNQQGQIMAMSRPEWSWRRLVKQRARGILGHWFRHSGQAGHSYYG